MQVFLVALMAWLFIVPSYAQEPREKEPKIYLVLTYVTPGRNTADIRQKFPMESMDECWANAHDFVERGVPDKLKDAVIATMAGCLVLKTEESDM